MSDSNQQSASKAAPNAIMKGLSNVFGNQNAILIGVLLSLVVVFSIVEPKFFSVPTASNILTDWGTVVLIAVGQTFVVISGGIDLSVGAIIGLSGVISAWFVVNVMGLGPTSTGSDVALGLFVGTVVAILVGLAVGLVNLGNNGSSTWFFSNYLEHANRWPE
jgi:ribose transport system permease protein